MDIVKTTRFRLLTACALNIVAIFYGCSGKEEDRPDKCVEYVASSVNYVNSLLEGRDGSDGNAETALAERLLGIPDDNSRLAAIEAICNTLLEVPRTDGDMVNAIKDLRMRNNVFCEAVESVWQTSKDEKAVFCQWRRWRAWNGRLFDWLSERRRVIDREYLAVRKESLVLQFKLTRVAIPDLSSQDRERLEKCRTHEFDLARKADEWSQLAASFNSSSDMSRFRQLGVLLLEEKSKSVTKDELRQMEATVSEFTKWSEEWHLDENYAVHVITGP